MGKILGLNFIGHDSSFAIVNNGRIEHILELERVNGDRFALHWELSSGKAKNINKHINDYIDQTLFFWEKYAHEIDTIAVAGIYSKKKIYQLAHKIYVHNLINTINKRFKTKISHNLFLSHHHVSHASLACFTSPFLSSVVASIDGQGNDGYFRIFYHKNNSLSKICNYKLRLGMAYRYNAEIVGGDFGHPQSAAGKLMGLSAYGSINKKYYIASKKMIKSFPKHKKILFQGAKDKRAQDWMKSFQNAWTDIIINKIKKHVKYGENLCMTGGCALNGITNYQVYNKITNHLYIPPNPNDCGIAAGAALNCYYVGQKNDYEPVVTQNPYIGVQILDKDIMHKYFSREDYLGNITINELCKIIKQNKIIGVINGNSEIGPRALGNRSIICDCSNPNMKNILNNKVKFREWYRPFAPVVRIEDVNKYFEFNGDSFYMSYVVPVKKEFQNKIPAVCHVDKTARVQTVTSSLCPFLYGLLCEYNKMFGVGVLLNTSFNIRGRAILTRLSDAFDILDKTGLDGLYVEGCFWCKK